MFKALVTPPWCSEESLTFVGTQSVVASVAGILSAHGQWALGSGEPGETSGSKPPEISITAR